MFEIEFFFGFLVISFFILIGVLCSSGLIIHFISFCVALFISYLVSNRLKRTRGLKNNISGKNVLITGGANGIGRELSIILARKSCNVVIWDIREIDMKSTVDEIKGNGGNVSTYYCDVGEYESIKRCSVLVQREIGDIDILINNAGIVFGKSLTSLDIIDIQRTMSVNLMSHFYTTKSFLPSMLQRNSGHIVSICSVAGIVGINSLSDYCASKFGVFGFTECLRRECMDTNIKTTLVCPWITSTGMFDGIKKLLLPISPHSPSFVAEKIVEAIILEEQLLIFPSILYLLPLTRLIPTRFQDWIGVFTRATTAAQEIKGRGRAWNFSS